MPSESQPVLRTLAPALRELERRLRAWLGTKQRYPLTTMQRATLDGLCSDLDRQADALMMERPLLTIMLMGGTGVGKSTLLNAMAGGSIAQASFSRPTTRDPVVYYHHSIPTNRLDPALQFCKLAAHDRPDLEQKILVDTPDLDSNDLANREKMMRVLPVADIVLYVGSQEKYHDKLGWDLFLQQKQRRAFAFVLNKWDRCLHPGALGARPDEDLLRDLQAEGFQHPLLFRTCAQHWVDHPFVESANGESANGEPPSVRTRVAHSESGVQPASLRTAARRDLPEGEQFLDLMRWLEQGLTRMEVEAIKARGVSQLLAHLHDTIESICPPDLTQPAERIRAAWTRLLGDEADDATAVLLSTLDPFQKEIEHHFANERQKHFGGAMGLYLHAFSKLRYTGSTLRDQIPLVPRSGSKVEAPPEWNLARFTEACSNAASEQHLHSRMKALVSRLLVEADTLGIPLGLLSEPTESLVHLDWRSRDSRAMIEVIATVERGWSQPSGSRKWLQKGVIFLADWVPGISFLSMCGVLLWEYFMLKRPFAWGDLLLPLVVVLIVFVILHVFIAICLPMRWVSIREQFHQQLEQRIRGELEMNFHQVLSDAVSAIDSERRQNENFLKEISEVSNWLAEREHSASIVNLYGK